MIPTALSPGESTHSLSQLLRNFSSQWLLLSFRSRGIVFPKYLPYQARAVPTGVVWTHRGESCDRRDWTQLTLWQREVSGAWPVPRMLSKEQVCLITGDTYCHSGLSDCSHCMWHGVMMWTQVWVQAHRHSHVSCPHLPRFCQSIRKCTASNCLILSVHFSVSLTRMCVTCSLSLYFRLFACLYAQTVHTKVQTIQHTYSERRLEYQHLLQFYFHFLSKILNISQYFSLFKTAPVSVFAN